MEVPIKTFWLLNYNIDRIQAQKDMRSMTVVGHAHGGGDTAVEFRERLVVETGTVIKMKVDPMRDAVRDESGFAALKEMSKQM